MNVYDFDDTIYDGDSSIDFFKFCCKNHKRTLQMLPGFAVSALLYFLKCRTKEQMKSAYFSFVKYIDDIDETVKQFWEAHRHKIKAFYTEKHRDDDIVISASPEFLLKPICDQLNVRLIATKVDHKTGKLLGKNCHGKEKVLRLAEATNEPIDQFYSDSLSDTPLSQTAKESFLVKGDSLLPWPKSAEQP